MNGYFLTFEGIDFSGKSTQAELLARALRSRKQAVLFLREPGGTEISEGIRELLLDVKHEKMSPVTELLLYSAARAQIVREAIRPHLEAGGVVVCDRYYDSTTAYQGYGRQLDLAFVKRLNAFATENTRPDLTFLIDIEPELALKRNREHKEQLDRLEQESLLFHKRVRQGYLELARQESERFVVLDGATAISELHEKILSVLQAKWPF